VTHHRATVDVIALGAGSSVIVYSTEVQPAEVGDHIGSSVDSAMDDLRSLA
jgi:hypothetical protein